MPYRPVARSFFLSCLVALSVAITACSGGGGGGGDDSSSLEGSGTETSPYVLNFPGDLPSSKTLSNGAYYYSVKGLTPGYQYLVTLKSSDPVSMMAWSPYCWEDGAPTPVLNNGGCIITAPDDGTIDSLLVYYSGSDYANPTGSYTINIQRVSHEGTAEAPMDLTGKLPYAGTTKEEIYNYYVIHGLTPGNSYTIADNDSSTSTSVYQDQFITGFCCTFTAASDTIWVRLRNTSGDGTFSLTLTDNGLPDPVYTAEGAVGAEIQLTLDVIHSGQTDNTASYYHIAGLQPNKQYGIGLDKVSGETVSLHVYNQAGYITEACSDDVASTSVDYDCAAAASDSGELWIKVDGSSSYRVLGQAYNLAVYTYFADEGTSSVEKPLTFTADMPDYSGTVDKASYYGLTGLEPGITYVATISGYDAGSDVSFNMAKEYNWYPGCTSTETEPGVESCSLVSSDTGNLSFEVYEPTYFKGTPFTLNVERSLYQSEGTTTTPLPLTLGVDLPYNGETGAASSHYEIAGLTPGQAYTITITGLVSGQEFYGYDALENVGKLTSSYYKCDGTSIDTNCTLRAIGTSVWLTVTNANLPNTFSIDAALSPYQFEGTIDAPVPMSFQVPHNGMVDFSNSYYEISGLTAGQTYVVTATGVSTASYIYMYIYNDALNVGSTVYGDYVCYKSAYDGDEKYCAVTPTGSSIWIMVDGSDYGAGALYTLNSDVAMDTQTADLDYSAVPAVFPYAGTTDNTASVYTILGLQPNQYYDVTLTNLSADLDLSVSASYNYLNSDCVPATGTTNEACGFTTDSTGQMVITVSGTKTLYGGSFTLGVNSGLENQGTLDVPVDVGVSYSGEVGYGASYYRITGLLPGTFYAVSLDNMTDMADLYLYEAGDYATVACQSKNTVTTAELCGAVSDISGYLWVKVDGLSLTGAAFNLVTVEGPVSEGSKGAEVPLTYVAGLSRPGSTVDRTASYYAISGLANNKSYSIVLTDLTGNVSIKGYLDGAYSVTKCSGSGTVGGSATCNFTTGTSQPTVYVEVSGASSAAGATYTLSMP